MTEHDTSRPELNFSRLSDCVFLALQKAVEQKDIDIAERLVRVMEMAMTRNAGGAHFIERRVYSKELEDVMARLHEMKAAARGPET